MIEILPAVHALTGCNSTSAIAARKSALRVAKTIGFEYLHSFGTIELTNRIIANVEPFLVKCISSNCSIDCFDELRHDSCYDKKFNFNLEKFPPTKESIRQHIKGAHLQCYLWLHSAFFADIKLNPLEYGYVEDDNEQLIPRIISGNHVLDGFPLPCSCSKCARAMFMSY